MYVNIEMDRLAEVCISDDVVGNSVAYKSEENDELLTTVLPFPLVKCKREAAVGKRLDPLHQVISAGGRLPHVRHSISVFLPADKTKTLPNVVDVTVPIADNDDDDDDDGSTKPDGKDTYNDDGDDNEVPGNEERFKLA